MILDYPRIYENELFFAYMLRFHRYRGESNITRSFQYFLQTEHYPGSVTFLSSLKKSLEDIRLSPERYAESHSVMPYYRVFCDRETYASLSPNLLTNKAYFARRMLQKQNPGIPTEQEDLYYCPICHSMRNGYADIQIYHQIPEVHVCAEHHCYLKKVSINSRKTLRTPETWDVTFETCTDAWLNGISEDVKYIMDTKPAVYVDIFREAFWDWFETNESNISFLEWIEWVQQRMRELPYEFRCYTDGFDFREFLTADNSAKLSGLEYLVLVRIMFGSFEEFVVEIS